MSVKIILKNLWNKLLLQFSLALFAFYLVIGFLFLFSDVWIEIIPDNRDVVGYILVGFGIVRFYISYSRYKKKHLKIQVLKEEQKNIQDELRNVKKK